LYLVEIHVERLFLQLQKKTEGVKKKFFLRKIFPFSPFGFSPGHEFPAIRSF
jgi:hypothetical protein